MVVPAYHIDVESVVPEVSFVEVAPNGEEEREDEDPKSCSPYLLLTDPAPSLEGMTDGDIAFHGNGDGEVLGPTRA